MFDFKSLGNSTLEVTTPTGVVLGEVRHQRMVHLHGHWEYAWHAVRPDKRPSNHGFGHHTREEAAAELAKFSPVSSVVEPVVE
jgi:hypothetical protein